MIISEKQIMQLISIAYTHMANSMRFGEQINYGEILSLLTRINDQQSEELKVIE